MPWVQMQLLSANMPRRSFQVVTGVLFPIVDVEQQLITQCIINSCKLASLKLWALA